MMLIEAGNNYMRTIVLIELSKKSKKIMVGDMLSLYKNGKGYVTKNKNAPFKCLTIQKNNKNLSHSTVDLCIEQVKDVMSYASLDSKGHYQACVEIYNKLKQLKEN